ncbi:MAG TPA: hypothetical protein VFM94_09370 [Solirubrobacterales bacterium]|nr:hypothetical protein [Solirubrobacterales bacterium]
MTGRSTLLLLSALILAVAAVFAGCGGSDDDSGDGGSSGGPTVTTSSLSQEEYVKQASAACEKIRKPLLKEVNAYLVKNDSKKVKEGVLVANMSKAVLLPTIEAEIEAVRKLGAPDGDEEEIESILAAQEASVEEVKGVKEAATLEEIESHFIGASKMYQDYGFTACTNSS